ncbi:MAG: acyl-CoA dehydrogenase family protein [bacterium]|nr:acyl-CoA dehydrogenase [Gammaproteobacteria bacterium]HIL94790.1 acyl-CoA dehydrogenase [Pseudomonadales bacterium]
MASIKSKDTLSASDILDNARVLAGRIREKDLASEYDRIRSLPADIVQEIRDAGIMRMNMPRIWGGPEMTSMEQVEVIEALSMADASVGWCSFIWCDSGIYSGYLDDAVGRQMYPQLDMATSGWVYPVGQAHRVDGGYNMSGQWMFGSGSGHCDWLVAGCTVFENGKPVLNDQGIPRWRIMFARPTDYEIQDTWYTTGLRGTGSNDYRCENVFVPEERSFSFFEPARREGTIWVRPDHLLRKMSGVPLGVARETIDLARTMLAEKGDRLTGQLYRDMPRVQSAIAQAQSILGSARSYVFSSLEKQWQKLESGQPLTEEERADVWLSRVNAFQACRQVVTLIYDTIGGSAIYAKKSPFDRHQRDLQTACQHVVGQTKTWEGAGRLLLGGESDHSMM